MSKVKTVCGQVSRRCKRLMNSKPEIGDAMERIGLDGYLLREVKALARGHVDASQVDFEEMVGGWSDNDDDDSDMEQHPRPEPKSVGKDDGSEEEVSQLMTKLDNAMTSITDLTLGAYSTTTVCPHSQLPLFALGTNLSLSLSPLSPPLSGLSRMIS